MKPWQRGTIIGLVILAVLTVVILKSGNREDARRTPQGYREEPTDAGATRSPDRQSAALPRLLELGSVGCRPCDMMAPILEELRKEYAGVLSVEFYDVRKDPWPARLYRIRIIPTQIFIDAEGNEVFRHEGFLPMDDIVPVLASMGVSD